MGMAWPYTGLVPALWLAWLLYWWLSAHAVKDTQRSESALSRWLHVGPLLLAGWLLAAPAVPIEVLNERFLPPSEFADLSGLALLVVGLAFSVWARHHLGTNWSGTITVKHAHELVRSGPYRCVRHPIYSGLLLAFLGSALVLGEWRGLVGLVIFWAALLRKLRVEEQWMREHFGTEYAQYQTHTGALLPRLARR
jgi:protein-S-isoprenylcysteine O-methyltransferase Ste14